MSFARLSRPAPVSFDLPVAGLLQRKCNCGGSSAHKTEECEDCRRNRTLGLQTKLTIGAPDDAFEREADRIADRVVAAPGVAGFRPGLRQTDTPSRRPVARKIDRKMAGGERSPIVAEALKQPGRALDPATRRFMETRMGHDFGRVRVHSGARAAQSADAVAARAYTVGNDVVFAAGAYRPETREGRRLLAHELTHTIQQAGHGGSPLSNDRRESEARQVASNFANGGPMPPISAATPALSRDDGPAPSGGASASEADAAEADCDMGTLCRLSFTAPDVVDLQRLQRVWRACHPTVPYYYLVGGNPCLTPDFGLPPGPTMAGEATPAPGPAPAPAGGGSGLELPSTTVRFNLGAAAFTVDLPSSLAVRLPLPFSGAEQVVISLSANVSGEFSLSIVINAVPHVRIIARASASTEGRGSAGLTVQTTRTTCNAVDPAAARSALERAGNRLRDAIEAVQSPPEPDPEASDLERTFAPHARLAEVAGAIANLNSEVERVSGSCREVPVASFDFGVQGPLTAPDTPLGPDELPPPSFIGGSLRLHF